MAYLPCSELAWTAIVVRLWRVDCFLHSIRSSHDDDCRYPYGGTIVSPWVLLPFRTLYLKEAVVRLCRANVRLTYTLRALKPFFAEPVLHSQYTVNPRPPALSFPPPAIPSRKRLFGVPPRTSTAHKTANCELLPDDPDCVCRENFMRVE